MNARCNNNSIFLFEKLSHLPLLCVHNHLNASSLFLNALLSEKWEALIRNEGKGMKLESMWDIDILPDALHIEVKFKNKSNQDFEIRFKENSKLQMAEDVKVHQQKRNVITFYHKTNEHLEESCFKALELLKFLFPPSSYGGVGTFLDYRSADFPFRFLSKLPRGTAACIDLDSDEEVDGADLVALLRNVTVENRRGYQRKNELDISLKIKNVVKSDEIVLNTKIINIWDGRFLSVESLKKLNCKRIKVKQNNFCSKDFNEFLRAWMSKSTGCRVSKASFDIREDQKIKIEEVMEGLNPHVGTPRIRDRWMIDFLGGHFGDLYPMTTDFSDGWDIKNDRGEIGTVLLEPNRLTFATWSSSPFRWHRYLISIENSIASFERIIACANKDREKIQKKVDAGKMELFPDQVDFLEDYPDMDRQDLRTACEIKEKLLTIWKNDAPNL